MGKFMMNGIEYSGGGSSGGGGNVDDVLVNGVSVVNENKEAEIVSYKEVTQSEYEALPDTKLTDGIAYFIKDSVEAEGFPPRIYSLQEREIGVWIDGKPLYEKTISYTPTSTISTNTVIGTIQNAEKMMFVSAFAYNSSANRGVMLAYAGDSTGDSISFNNGAITLVINNDSWNSSWTIYVTAQYTKTTDTAGQGIWAGNGAMAHHYSENEQIVGTGTNGKPIYEITKVITGSYSKGSENVFTVNVTNASNVRIAEGYIVYNSSVYIPVNIYINSNAIVYVYFVANSNSIEIHINSTEWDYTRLEIALRYQKTTD